MSKKPTAKKTPAKRKPARRKPTKTKQPEQKNFNYSDIWQPIGGSWNGLSNAYDSFGSEPNPSAAELVGAFRDVVFSCATMIAESLAEIGIKLVAETKGDQRTPDPSKSSKIGGKLRHRSKALDLHEIHDNPCLDLLYKPNDDMTWADLITATSVDLDIIGRAFWLITNEAVGGLPSKIQVLPAYLVVTERDDAGAVIGYQFGAKENKDDGPTFKPEQVLAFRKYEHYDPEREGVSPAKAVWQKLQLSAKELSSWEIICSQMAHPSVSFSPKDANAPMSEAAVERFVKEYQSRLARGGQGGPLFINEAVDLNVLSFPPKDTAGLQLQDNLKTSITNAYHIPRPQMDMQDANFAASKSSERSYQLNCLKPRINYILERATLGVVRQFDPRLFLMPEDFVERDELLEEQRKVNAITAYTSQIVTKNEARAVFDLPADPMGNSYFVPPAPSAPAGMGLSLSLPEGVIPPTAEAKAATPDDSQYDRYSLKPVVAIMTKWFDVQKNYALDQARSKSFKTKSWVSLSQFTEDMAHELRPALQVYYDGASKAFAQKYGLTDEIWSVTTPKIAEAVERAALHLAESTNQTTALALDEARERLRQELADGLTTGDSVAELTKRVSSIFDSATEERAWLIADSERTRAIGTGELITAKESGVVKAKVWLPDSQACPKCAALNGVAKSLDEPFAVDARGGPYSVIQHPPRHPGCRCVQTFVLKDD